MAGKLYKKVERCYNAGEVIFEQGDASDGIYSVKLGKVSVYKTKPSTNGPSDVEIIQLGPGSMFGEMGMLDRSIRDASVKALEYTECVVITHEMFETQMATLPPWVVNFIKILIGRLRSTNARLLSAVQTLESHGLATAETTESVPTIQAAKGPTPTAAGAAGPATATSAKPAAVGPTAPAPSKPTVPAGANPAPKTGQPGPAPAPAQQAVPVAPAAQAAPAAPIKPPPQAPA